jgi:capsular polysaccharide biosynthesis protein
MSMRDFVHVIIRRWWVIVVVTGLTVGGALAYSKHEHRKYQATATVFAHPSKVVTNAGDYSSDLGLLSYGSLSQTFASLAQSKSMLAQAAAALGVAPDTVKDYSAVATLLPQTTVLELSVDGPDRDLVIGLANRLSTDVSAATTRYFHIFSLTTLDAAAAPSTQILPQTSRNLLYGGLAGLIVGFILAVLSLYLPELMAAAAAVPSRSRPMATPEYAPALGTVLPLSAQTPGEVEAPSLPLRGISERDSSLPRRPTAAANDHWYGQHPSGMPADNSTAPDQGRLAL